MIVGFSFTGSDAGYARNESVVGEDLYQALLQFFQLFPELQKNEFYVTGESYGGTLTFIMFKVEVMLPENLMEVHLHL